MSLATGAAGDAGMEVAHRLHRADEGFLVLADISGFTAFTTTTEIEHGAAVTAALLGDVADALSPPLEIHELEGDAVFALGPDGVLPAEAPLLDVLRRALEAFRERQQEIAADTSCACLACSGAATLGLKVVVHHGRFVRHRVARRSRVAGPDVILAHRLLKNAVDHRAYIALTEAAAERLGSDTALTGATAVTTTYEHFGAVRCFVIDAEYPASTTPAAVFTAETNGRRGVLVTSEA